MEPVSAQAGQRTTPAHNGQRSKKQGPTSCHPSINLLCVAWQSPGLKPAPTRGQGSALNAAVPAPAPAPAPDGGASTLGVRAQLMAALDRCLGKSAGLVEVAEVHPAGAVLMCCVLRQPSAPVDPPACSGP